MDRTTYDSAPQCFKLPELEGMHWRLPIHANSSVLNDGPSPRWHHDWFQNQVGADFRSLTSDNYGFTLFASYALYPPLVAHIWPGMWTLPRIDLGAWITDPSKAWRTQEP